MTEPCERCGDSPPGDHQHQRGHPFYDHDRRTVHPDLTGSIRCAFPDGGCGCKWSMSAPDKVTKDLVIETYTIQHGDNPEAVLQVNAETLLRDPLFCECGRHPGVIIDWMRASAEYEHPRQ